MRRVTLVTLGSAGLRAGKSPAFLVLRGLARSGRSRTKKPGMRIFSRNVARVPPKVVHGSRLRSWRTVPARSNQAPGRQRGARAQPVNHDINQGADTNLAGAV
jgi:hypothetical protein